MIKPNLLEAKKRTNKEVLIKTNEYIVKENLKELGKNKNYFVKTYGCQMNEHDSENIKAILEDMGFTEADNMEEADLILLNTCAIRENAHNKVFGMLGRIKHLKETRKDIIVILCGCMAQEEVVVNEIMKKEYGCELEFVYANYADIATKLVTSVLSNQAPDLVKVRLDDGKGTVHNLELLENLNNISNDTYKTKLPYTVIKTALRVAAKKIGSEAGEKAIANNSGSSALGLLGGLIFDVVAASTEGADLRGCFFMPAFASAGETFIFLQR